MMLIGWLPSLAHDFEVNGVYYDKINSSTVEVTYQGNSYDSYSDEYIGDVVIPSSVKCNGVTYSVTSIGDYAFRDCKSLTSIEIPNSVTSIGYDAFYRCSSLTDIEIPNSVTSIEDFAFSGCKSLTSIQIPNSVRSIGSTAFSSCSSLTSIVVNPGNTKYDSRNGCNAIIETASNTLIAGCQNTIIPNNVTSIGKSAFYYCTSLTSIEIPNNVTSIESTAFMGCSNLTSIKIPNSVTSIGSSAFSWCESLTSIQIPNSVTSIESQAFSECSSLTSIEIHNSVTSIGVWAFMGCSSLTSIEIPNSVTSIGNNAFSDCSSLTSIVVNPGNTKYDSRNGCNAIIETASNTLIAGCKNTIIPNSVTSIESRAFYGCESLTSIEIPNSVTSIEDDAFSSCSSLTSIVVNPGNTKYDSRNGCNAIIETASNTLIAGCKNTIIPNSVTSIGESAFYDCESLTSIQIPNSVTRIGDYAFAWCKSLTSIQIGNSVTSIESRAFYGCESLTKITCLATIPPTTGYSTFDSYSAELYVPAGCISAYQSAYDWRNFNIKELPIIFSTSIVLNKTSASLKANETLTLVATVLPENATDKSVTWKSSNEAVATVDANGMVTAVAVGEATITATTADGSNLSASCKVTVVSSLAQSITLDKTDVSLEVTETATLVATVLPETTSNKSVEWKSSNEAVATVDANGKVTAVAVGEATITATTADGSNLSASCKIIVKPTLATSISLDYTEYEMAEKAEFQLTATILPESTTNKGVVWGSSDMWVASVDENGLVRAYSVGETVITATTIDGSNLSASCKITVAKTLASSISLDKTSATLKATETLTLKATIAPATTTNKSVAWKSSNEAIATVDANGKVTAVAVGEATIIATTADGSNLSASCEIIVKPTLATSITLDYTEYEIAEKAEFQLTATILPESTTNKGVVWGSSDMWVASVDENGLVRAYSVGETVITATTIDGSNLSASCKVTVVSSLAQSITLDKTEVSLEVTETAALVATVLPETTSNKSVEWKSSNEAVATVNNKGEVTAIAVGEATITVTTVDGSNLSASCTVTVVPTLAESIALDKTEISLEATETATLVATVLPELATDKSVKWSSSDKAVAVVDENGVVTAVSVGEAIITATTTDGSNLSASCKVTVLPTLAESITLDKTEISLEATETATLVATVLPETTSNKGVEWTSSDKTVAVVDENGVVTAVSVGEATITATTTDGSNLSASCKVTVVPTLAVSIELDQTEASVEEKSDLQLTATILPKHTTNKEVAWGSSDKWVATVDNTGLVTMYSAGEVIITATTTDGTNISAACHINVYSGINGVNGDDVIVATIGDNIVVKNAKLGSIVNVYASNGALVASEVATDGSVVVETPVKGVYVVKVGKQTVKVII